MPKLPFQHFGHARIWIAGPILAYLRGVSVNLKPCTIKLAGIGKGADGGRTVLVAVSYTHLTLPTILRV